MSALLKSLAEVSKNAFKAPDLKLIHSKIVPVPDLRTEKARAEKKNKTIFISLGALAGCLLFGYVFSVQIVPLLKKEAQISNQSEVFSDATPKQLMADSVLAYHNRDFKKAISGFQKLTKLNAADYVSLNNLALSLKSSGNIKEARAFFQQGTQKFPKDSVLFNNYGVLEFGSGSMELAEQKFKAALALRPTYREALLNLAHLYEVKGNWTGALEIYEKYLEGKTGESALNEKLRERIRRINSLSQASKNTGDRI